MPEKKIVYVHTGSWPSNSPSTVFVTGTASGIACHAQALFIVRNGSTDPTDTVYRTITGDDIPEALEIERKGFGGKTPGHSRFFRQALSDIKKLARDNRLRAVITRNVGFLPYLAYIKKRYGVPCLFETHDFYSDLDLRDDIKKTLHIRRNSFFEKTFIPRISGLLCLTETQRALFAKHYPDTPSVLARTGLFRGEKNDIKREKRISYVGSLDPHKGVGLILAALQTTVDREIGLTIIGGKNEHEVRDFLSLADSAGLEGRVTISGWLRHADVGPVMDRTMAGVVPLKDNAFNRYITSPLKIFDCFSRALPVIGADLPPVRELVEDTVHGLLFKPGDPEALAEAIDRFFAADMHDGMAKKIEHHASSFLWSNRGKAIADFIDSLA